MPKTGRSKYLNKKTGGYDSGLEARRAGELELLQRAGKIFDLRKQVRFKILPSQDGERPVFYVADFVFRDASGEMVVEDAKSEFTRKNPTYILKRKMMLFVHGIKIREVS